jgi:predicted dehydrogenase
LKAAVISKKPLKISLVGCGKIADSHLAAINRIGGCQVISACDRELLMAGQLCERFAIPHAYSDLEKMLRESRPDVVHITSPPQTHFDIGMLCLSRGAHIYVEKPFTVNYQQAEELIHFAETADLKVTVGHDLQFSHVTRRLRGLVRAGYLGGPPLHLESYYCYDLGDPVYAKTLLADKQHWVRHLPGKLLHNIISHGIARIAEFLQTDKPRVFAYGFTSPLLRRLGEEEILDELRVVISDQGPTTAYFTFSSQMRPSLNQFRIFGSKNGLQLDEDEQSLLMLRGERYKSYAGKFIPPLAFTGQHLGNLCRNARSFLANDFHLKSGMKFLIESLYRSIAENDPVPIPYREILLTSRIMDEVFQQTRASHP